MNGPAVFGLLIAELWLAFASVGCWFANHCECCGQRCIGSVYDR
jgi:hypothetical protein